MYVCVVQRLVFGRRFVFLLVANKEAKEKRIVYYGL